MEEDNEKPTKVKIIFPTPLAEKLGLNKKFFDNPIGKKKYIITHSVDLKTTIRQLFVYLDIASYTFLDDMTAPTIRCQNLVNFSEIPIDLRRVFWLVGKLLSCPLLCFIIVCIRDLFVSRDDPLMS